MIRTKLFITFAIILVVSNIACTQQSGPPDKNEISTIIDTCVTAFRTHYVYPEKVSEIKSHIQKSQEDGKYEDLHNLKSLTKQLRSDFRAATNDRHIWIDIMDNLPVIDSDVSDQIKMDQLEKENFGFGEIENLTESVVCLKLNGFKDLKYARKTATEVMQKLGNYDIIIIDLRENHGGHSNMVHFISSYFFAEQTQLNSLYFRERDSLATAWTDPEIAKSKLVDNKLFLLTSKNTASAAESFAYTMKNYERATIVGESTRGAGHWTESFQYPRAGYISRNSSGPAHKSGYR